MSNRNVSKTGWGDVFAPALPFLRVLLVPITIGILIGVCALVGHGLALLLSDPARYAHNAQAATMVLVFISAVVWGIRFLNTVDFR